MSNNPVMPTLSPGGTDFTSVKKKSRGRGSGSARDDMEMESEPGEGTTFSFEIHNLEADSPEDPKDEEKPVGPNAVAA